MSIKVLMVTREDSLARRYGLGKSLIPIIDELRHQGVDVGYITQDDAGAKSVEALRAWHSRLNRFVGWMFRETDFYSLSWGLLERFNMGRLAAKVAQEHGFTHVHCHDPIIAAAYRWFARFRQRRLREYGVTQHGFGSYTQAFHEDGAVLGAGVMRWLRSRERRALAKADWVLIPAQCGAEQLARDLGHYPVPAHWRVIPHPRPAVSVHDKMQARTQLGWAPEAVYIIAVGRFAPLKRLPDLVRACASVKGKDWRLILVGDGDREELRALAESLGIGERVDFAVTDDIGIYYSAADVYVSTSSTESFGLANLEALIAGMPALCTAVGCTPEVLGSGAWMIPPENLPALTSALQSLLDDPGLREFWSRQARAWTAAWPGPGEVAAAYLAMYRGEPLPDREHRVQPAPDRAPFAAWRAQTAAWPICPLPQPLDLPVGGAALVLAPHSDDETFGCGGTLALLRQAGWRIKVVVATDGARGDPEGYLDGDVVVHRQRETRAALAVLGVEDVDFLGEPDGDFFHKEEVASRFADIWESFAPDWLLVPPVLDFHRDHVNASLMALDLWQSSGCRERLFFYELWQPLPVNRVVDVTPVLALKQRAMEAYGLPMRYGDYSDAFDGIMRYRGFYLEGHAGKHAEALLEVDKVSWRPVVASLMQLRANQERTVS